VIEKGDEVYLHFSMDDSFAKIETQLITTALLGKAKMPKQAFENADGSALEIESDYFGLKRNKENPMAGPFENINEGVLRFKVW